MLVTGLPTTSKTEELDTSAASVTEVNRRLNAGSLIIGVIAENRSAATAEIGIECAALQDGVALETEGVAIQAIGSRKKGYAQIVFDRVHRVSVEVSCWIDAIDTVE